MSFEAKIQSVVKTMFKVMVNRGVKELNYKTLRLLQNISQNKSKIKLKTKLV